METMRSYETSVLSEATRRYRPEDCIIHSHRRENKPYKWLTDGAEFVNDTRQPCLTLLQCPWYSFLLETESLTGQHANWFHLTLCTLDNSLIILGTNHEDGVEALFDLGAYKSFDTRDSQCRRNFRFLLLVLMHFPICDVIFGLVELCLSKRHAPVPQYFWSPWQRINLALQMGQLHFFWSRMFKGLRRQRTSKGSWVMNLRSGGRPLNAPANCYRERRSYILCSSIRGSQDHWPVFFKWVVFPYIPSKIYGNWRMASSVMLCRAHLVITDVSEALSSSGTSVLPRSIRHNIPEDAILPSHRRESLKSYYGNWSISLARNWPLGPVCLSFNMWNIGCVD
jgi:hypothetical protein